MVRLKRLIREIHERSLWQALVVYLGASYAVLEAVDLFIERFGLPSWLFPVAFFLLLVGLPLVVAASLTREEVYGADVPAEAAWDVDEAGEADDNGSRVYEALRPERAQLVDLQRLRLPVDDEPQRPSHGHDREWLVGRVERQTPHVFRRLLRQRSPEQA